MQTLTPTHTPEIINALLNGTIGDPHAFLGMHPLPVAETTKKQKAAKPALVVRAFVPGAEAVTVVERGGKGARVALGKISEAGIFAATVPGKTVFPYDLEITRGGHTWTQGEPYRFLPTLGDLDIYLAGEGNHRRLYNALGAHPREMGGIKGVSFAVWAPSARGVSLIGDFNGWHARALPLRALGSSGIWELFVPGLVPGEVYKYAICAGPTASRRSAPTRSASGASCAPRPPRSSATSTRMPGATRLDGGARGAEPLHRADARSTRSTSAPGCAARGGNRWLTYRELADQLSPTTSTDWASPTSSCCRSPSTRSTAPGATR